MARKLASIQIIKSLSAIPNADHIEVAEILGWHCVVKKGDFKVGDRCCYFEIDSFLPTRPEYEFLRKGCLRKTDFGEGFRIKTIRLKGQISQGLALKLPANYIGSNEQGFDMTDKLDVKLYSPPIPAELKGLVKGNFPTFLQKSDETRVQVLQDVLSRWTGTMCYVTEKVDGTSATYFIKDGVFGVCSRNLELLESEGNAYWRIARELDIENKLRALNKNIMIQGEIFGHGLQGNPLKQDRKRIMFFNAFDIDKYTYYNCLVFMNIIKDLGLETVPIIVYGWNLIGSVDKLVNFATQKSLINPQSWAEGIVIRPVIEQMDMQMAQGFGSGRVSFKVINPEYLLVSDN
jgi:RNA ligase (TIGR02306 family)